MKNCLLGFNECNVERPCVMHEIWLETKTKMVDTLKNTTLADLREKHLQRVKD
jgi:DNA-binding IscR family transcriptional regulator